MTEYHREEQRKLHVDIKHGTKILYIIINTVHMKLMLGSTLQSPNQVLKSGTTQVDGAVLKPTRDRNSEK